MFTVIGLLIVLITGTLAFLDELGIINVPFRLARMLSYVFLLGIADLIGVLLYLLWRVAP